MKVNRPVVTGLLVMLLACTGVAEPATRPVARRERLKQGQEPEKVAFFIYLLDIDDISGQDQSFHINLHLWLRWRDERLAHEGPRPIELRAVDVWNPTVILANRQALLRMSLPEVVEVDPDGTVNYRQQYVGPLSQPLSLADFPFDTQDFTIHFLCTGARIGEIEFVPHTVPALGITGGAMAETFSLPDWKVLSHKAGPKPLRIKGVPMVPGFAFTFIAKRHIHYYVLQIILPFVLIVMMSWAPFWVDPTKAGLQLGLAASTVLTLIAYRFYLVNLVPKLPYMTRLDYLMTSGTVIVFLAFLEVVVTSVLSYGNRAPLGRRVDRISRVAFPASFLASFIWSLFL